MKEKGKRLLGIGCSQLLKGRSLLKVDYDIIFLGVYYIFVIFGYLIFELMPINYRPILIDVFMVLGRLISGVHWLTDIVGSIMLSVGLFCVYKASVLLCYKGEN